MVTSNIIEILKLGISAHKRGEAKLAEKYYQDILLSYPHHPDANHNYGILLSQHGLLDEALTYFDLAINQNPKISQFWLSFIDTAILANLTDIAHNYYFYSGLNGCKGSDFEQRKYKLYKISTKITIREKNLPKNIFRELVALLNTGCFSDLLSKIERHLQNFPNSTDLFNMKGLTCYYTENFYEATRAFEKSIEIKGDNPAAYNNLGNVYTKLGDYEKAQNSYIKAIFFKPQVADSYSNLGNVLRNLGKLDYSISCCKLAIERNPRKAEFYNNLGNSYKNNNNFDKAKNAYKKAILISPDFSEPYNNLGVLETFRGKKDKAKVLLKRSIKLDRMNIAAHRNLSAVLGYKKNSKHLEKMKNILQHEMLSPIHQCFLHFSCFKAYDELENYDSAFESLKVGNLIKKQLTNYNIEVDKKLFKQIKKNHYRIMEEQKKVPINSTKITPVFILGMPRSGTSIVEQILSSHPKVYGGGELNYVSQLGSHLAIHQKFSTAGELHHFAIQYVKKICELNTDVTVFTDKMPHNFLFTGLICEAINNSRIIHIHRDPKATCWSNYKTLFDAAELNFCYDMHDTIEYFNLYQDLMRFWTKYYPGKIYHLDYEKLVINNKKETEKLLDFIDLSWDNRCLAPERNNRPTATASASQVKERIYQGSSKSWENYSSYLNDFFEVSSLEPWK